MKPPAVRPWPAATSCSSSTFPPVLPAGCYVVSGGEAVTSEAIYMAGVGQYKVLSVDDRRPADARARGAVDDGVAVWKAAL